MEVRDKQNQPKPTKTKPRKSKKRPNDIKKHINPFFSVAIRSYSQKLNANGALDNQDHKTIIVPYREAIGSLLYVSQGTRPDIAYAVNFLSRFCEQPKLAHWNAVKRIIRYLKLEPQLGIIYSSSIKSKNKLIAFSDSDFGGDLDTRHSTSGYMLMLNHGPVIWKSSKQKTIASSTTEAEFVAASVSCREIIWARQLLKELRRDQIDPTPLLIDNQGAICLIKNNQLNNKTKHIQIKYLLILEAQSNCEVLVEYINTNQQKADMLTKALPRNQLKTLIVAAGMIAIGSYVAYCNLAEVD